MDAAIFVLSPPTVRARAEAALPERFRERHAFIFSVAQVSAAPIACLGCVQIALVIPGRGKRELLDIYDE